MELSTYQIALISGGFGIAGTLLGVICTYYLATKLADTHAAHARTLAEIAAFREAGIRLRAAFTPALAFLDKARRHNSDHERPDADVFLQEAFVSYAAAIEDFRPFVRADDLGAYQQAWESYCQIAHAPKNSSAVFMATTIDRGDPWTVLQNQIHAILLFAKT